MYSYIARIKNKTRIQKNVDDIYWWPEVKKKRDNLKKIQQKERKEALQANNKVEWVEVLESGDLCINLGADMDAAVEEQPKKTYQPPKWKSTKVLDLMDDTSRSRLMKYFNLAVNG